MPLDRISQDKFTCHPFFSYKSLSNDREVWRSGYKKKREYVKCPDGKDWKLQGTKIKTISFIVRVKKSMWHEGRGWCAAGLHQGHEEGKESCLHRQQEWRHHYLRTYHLIDTLQNRI